MSIKGLNPNGNRVKLTIVLSACLLTAGIVYSNSTGRMEAVGHSEVSVGYLSASDDAAKARAAFNEAATVFFSPRCANCHSTGDFPTQGDDMTQHFLDVMRGDDGKGTDDMSCNSCHQDENTEGDGLPPGAPNWHMPPSDQRMPFQDLTAGDLCRQLKDPARNGGRKTLEESIEHMKGDPLVLWAWSPGNDRTTPPLSHADFMKKMTEWAGNGGACPE